VFFRSSHAGSKHSLKLNCTQHKKGIIPKHRNISLFLLISTTSMKNAKNQTEELNCINTEMGLFQNIEITFYSMRRRAAWIKSFLFFMLIYYFSTVMFCKSLVFVIQKSLFFVCHRYQLFIYC
jgi:hypothetical protein